MQLRNQSCTAWPFVAFVAVEQWFRGNYRGIKISEYTIWIHLITLDTNRSCLPKLTVVLQAFFSRRFCQHAPIQSFLGNHEWVKHHEAWYSAMGVLQLYQGLKMVLGEIHALWTAGTSSSAWGNSLSSQDFSGGHKVWFLPNKIQLQMLINKHISTFVTIMDNYERCVVTFCSKHLLTHINIC